MDGVAEGDCDPDDGGAIGSGAGSEAGSDAGSDGDSDGGSDGDSDGGWDVGPPVGDPGFEEEGAEVGDAEVVRVPGRGAGAVVVVRDRGCCPPWTGLPVGRPVEPAAVVPGDGDEPVTSGSAPCVNGTALAAVYGGAPGGGGAACPVGAGVRSASSITAETERATTARKPTSTKEPVRGLNRLGRRCRFTSARLGAIERVTTMVSRYPMSVGEAGQKVSTIGCSLQNNIAASEKSRHPGKTFLTVNDDSPTLGPQNVTYSVRVITKRGLAWRQGSAGGDVPTYPAV